jgi:hypothetical protein
VGEAADKPVLRRIAGPLLMILVAAISYGVGSLRTSFDTSIRYSGATKNFTSALVSAIDRGDVDAAHSELRRFDSVSLETYEGGAFLRWLRESTTRLSGDARADTNRDVGPDETEIAPGASDNGEQADEREPE